MFSVWVLAPHFSKLSFIEPCHSEQAQSDVKERDVLAAVLVTLWRWTMAICDWRAHWRFLTGRAAIDVAIITNVRDEQEKHLFWGSLKPRDGHSSGARIYMLS